MTTTTRRDDDDDDDEVDDDDDGRENETIFAREDGRRAMVVRTCARATRHEEADRTARARVEVAVGPPDVRYFMRFSSNTR